MFAMLMALTLVAAACGGGDEEGGEDDAGGGGGGTDCNWNVGTIGALSGDLATIGGPINAGIAYGVEAANEEFDLPCELSLVEEDSQGAEDKAPQLAQNLVTDEELVAVVGPYFSGETLAAGDIFDEAAVPFLTPSATNPDLSNNGWTHFFRLVGTDAQQASEVGTYLNDVEQAESVVVLHDNTEYGKPLAEGVAEAVGAEDVIAINPEETDHSAEISAAQDTGADAVFFGGYQPEFSEILKQADEAGFEATFVSADGSKAPELAEDPSAEGSIVTCPCDDPAASQNPDANTFAKEFEEAEGDPPGTYATEGYDGVFLVATALEESGLDGEASIEEVRTAIRDYAAENSYEGLSKTYEFDEKGELGTVSIFAYETKADAPGGFEQLGLISEL